MEYGYPTSHRILEIIGIGIFVICFFLLSEKIITCLWLSQNQISLTTVILIPVAAYLTADFISGFVHFLCDNFGSPETPLFGEGFIKAFREHHDDPQGIVRHDFIEVNGNTCLAAILPLVLIYFLLPIEQSLASLNTGLFVLLLLLFLVLTNQFHKWAHQSDPPSFVAWLQRRNLILAPDHHNVHHAPPYDKYYCITCGWLNAVLSRTRFFEFAGKAISRTFRSGHGDRKP